MTMYLNTQYPVLKRYNYFYQCANEKFVTIKRSRHLGNTKNSFLVHMLEYKKRYFHFPKAYLRISKAVISLLREANNRFFVKRTVTETNCSAKAIAKFFSSSKENAITPLMKSLQPF